MAIERVGVVGTGQMGAGIVEVCARAGLDVVAHEPDRQYLDAGRARVAGSLERAVTKNKLTQDDADAALDAVTWSTDVGTLADRDLVIEAIVEHAPTKLELFARLDAATGTGAILATNTSSLPIARIAAATQRPERVLGIHFFNPAPVLPLVELVPSLSTSAAVLDAARAFAQDTLGKTCIVAKDQAGFVVNALLIPYLLSAIRMLDHAVASAPDIDRGMELGCAHPMGPLRLADLIGLDTVAAVADAMYEEFAEATYACPPLLRRMVQAGRLGRKTGHGFHDYAG